MQTLRQAADLWVSSGFRYIFPFSLITKQEAERTSWNFYEKAGNLL